MENEIDSTVADRSDSIPDEMLDEIVAEYERGVMFDGQRLVATGGRDGLNKAASELHPGRNEQGHRHDGRGGP